jgi:hypothetical protein
MFLWSKIEATQASRPKCLKNSSLRCLKRGRTLGTSKLWNLKCLCPGP